MRLLFSVLLFAAIITSGYADSKAQDAARGEKLFRRCAACHTVDEGGSKKIGPNLFGVVGRDIATKDGFRYSEALLGLDGNWTDEALNQYLLSPRTYARGTKMTFAGLRKTQDRADVIAWLKLQIPATVTNSIKPDAPLAEDPDLALLVEGVGRLETYEGCVSCHSIKLVVQQGMNKTEWLETIEWMVDEQGMDPLTSDLNEVIADYLATHYGRDRPNFPK